jgi:hypothetical protein
VDPIGPAELSKDIVHLPQLGMSADPEQQFVQNMHIRMVRTPNIQLIPDTALEINRVYLSKEGTMVWNSFFKPTSSCENSVTIPGHWVIGWICSLLGFLLLKTSPGLEDFRIHDCGA